MRWLAVQCNQLVPLNQRSMHFDWIEFCFTLDLEDRSLRLKYCNPGLLYHIEITLFAN